MLLTLIGIIPGVLSAFKAWQDKKLDTQVEIFKAKTGADSDTARNLVIQANIESQNNTERLRIVSSNKWLTFLFVFMTMPVALYLWQTVFVDKIACKWIWGTTCSTDPIGGEVAHWCSLIIAATFGYGAVQGIAKTWFSGRRG